MTKDLLVGIDTASSGCVAVVNETKIIDICKYPALEYNKGEEKLIDAKIKLLENQPRSATKIKALKAEKKALKRRGYRNFKILYDFLYKYKDDIKVVSIEEPLMQTVNATSIQAIFANALSLGVYQTICSILNIPYKLYRPQEWHDKLGFYNMEKGLTTLERRERIKQISIEKCQEIFSNADDFIIEKGHKKPNDNIAESILISLMGEE